MYAEKSRAIDILTLLLYVSLFMISSESFNGAIISLGAAVASALIVAIDAFYNNFTIKFKITVMHIWIIIFAAFCYFSAVWAEVPNLAIDKGTSIVKNGICVFLIYIYYQKCDSIKHLLKTMMYGGYALIVLSVCFVGLDSIAKLINSSTRMEGEFLNQNTLGMLAALTIIINIYFIIYYREEKIGLPFAALSLIVLAAAGSRKSILELVFGVLLLLLLKNYNKKKIFQSALKIVIVLLVFAILVAILSELPMFDFIKLRLENLIHQLTGSGHTDRSIRNRALLDVLGWQIFTDNPILGVGMDCARIPVRQITGIDYYLHNNYLELLADGGVVGFILYFSFYVIIIHRFWKYRKFRDAEYDICLVIMIIQLVIQFAYVAYYGRETYFYNMLFFLETEIISRKSKKERNMNYTLNSSEVIINEKRYCENNVEIHNGF